MKFTINVEMTPEELRRTLGWPDVGSLQDELIKQAREQVKDGAADYDPLELVKPFLRSGVGNAEAFQKLMLTLMSQYGRRDEDKPS